MRVRSLVWVVVVMLGAAACGSSAKSNAAAGSTTVPLFSGSSGSSFRKVASQTASALVGVNPATSSPAEVKKAYEALGSALDKARAVAPADIKGDFETYAAAYKTFLSALAAARYKLTAKSSAALETASAKSAHTRIQQYLTQVCITPTT